MFCALSDLVTESDVEQKFVYPLLTCDPPTGLGLLPADILTKTNLRRHPIGKGKSSKLYYPDYLIVLAGLPLLVIEVKAPTEPIATALDEARLYGNEVKHSSLLA